MPSSAQLAYRFNGFRVDPVRRLLFGADEEPIPLKPKVFDTLLYLVERPGVLVDKQALLEAVWPHVVVEENNLNKAVSTLRQVLGETRDEHRFIVTEPGRGYRFVASVEVLAAVATEPPPAAPDAAFPHRAVRERTASPALDRIEPGGRAEVELRANARTPLDSRSQRLRLMLAWAAVAAAGGLVAIGIYWLATVRTESTDGATRGPPPNSVAVLPFDNLSPDPDDAYFAVGIHEEILNQVAKIGDLHVRSRNSVKGYAGTHKLIPEIARELDVETVLDGSVRYADGHVVVTAHLSDGRTNTTLWSESYKHEFSNIFAIQSEIALNVARALKAELLPAERERVTRVPTTSLPAYDLYLSASARQWRETPAEILLAIKEVEQALELDPDFALAWALKAHLRAAAQYYDPERGAEHRLLGEHAARVALDLDPSLGTAYSALGLALSTMKNWTGAEAAYRKALDLNVPLGDPNGYSTLQLAVGKFEYAREILQEARETTPQEPTVLRFLIMTNALLDEWPTAVAQYESGLRLFMPWREGENLMRHLRVGRNELEEARAIPAADPISAAMIANLDAPETALRELRRLYASTGPGNATGWRNIAFWAGHFRDPKLALDAMRAAVNEQGGQAAYLWLPQLQQMRRLPEFKAFLREIGIVEYWQEYGWPAICRPVDGDDFDCD